MDKNLNSAGYDLYEINENEWHFVIKEGPVYIGTFKKVVKYAANMGFKLEEIEIAIGEMMNKGHNAAHFGMYKSFIYTFNIGQMSDAG